MIVITRRLDSHETLAGPVEQNRLRADLLRCPVDQHSSLRRGEGGAADRLSYANVLSDRDRLTDETVAVRIKTLGEEHAVADEE